MQPEPTKPVIKKIKPPVPEEKPLRVIWPQDFYYYSYNRDLITACSLPRISVLIPSPTACCRSMLMRAKATLF